MVVDEARTKLSRLALGEQFSYEFAFGDGWLHLCSVGATKVDPLDELRIVPDRPLPYFGWGDLPDQYGRRWDADVDDDAETPADPKRSHLPPLEPGWGEPASGTGGRQAHIRRLETHRSGLIEVALREDDRSLLANETLCDPELVERLQPGRSSGEVVGRYTPTELDDLLGFVAGESNHARTKKLRASLDDLYARLEEFEDQARFE